MLKLGITGGMGSGKTTACRLFELWGIPVYYADIRAKALMTEDAALRKALTGLFGKEIYLADGALNRPHLAGLVFQNEPMLNKLNSLVHPAVKHDYERWHLKQKNVPYTIKEAALMFESGSYKQLDAVITVTAPIELRIQRTMQRDRTTREAVLHRIRHQLGETERNRRAQYVLHNNEHHSLIEQVAFLHQQLISSTTTLF